MRTADPRAPTKERILDASVALMLEHGYAATSVDRILAAAGATKSSFFHFFKSKEDLGKAALARFTRERIDMFRRAPFQKETDPRARVLGRIDAVIAAFSAADGPTSCLVGNLAQELAETHPRFRAACAEAFRLSLEGFADDLAAAGVRDGGRLSDMLMSLVQGSHILGKTRGDSSVGVENTRHFRRYVEGLLDGRKRRR